MAANSFSNLAPVNFMPRVQRFLNKKLIAIGIANTKFSAQVSRSGQSIDWPTIVDQRSQTYTPGVDLEIDTNTASSDTIDINRSRASTFTTDPVSEKQAEDKTVASLMANQSAHVIAQELDQFVLTQGIDEAASTLVGGTITVSSVYALLTNVTATLQRRNATDRQLFAVLDPERIALLSQSEVANGFNLADSALKNGFVGKSQAGLLIFNSNNLPSSVVLSMATIPTATDTLTIAGVLWTWVAAGAATLPGDIAIGGNVGAAQVNFNLAIAGTATGSATTYIDVSKPNRRIYQNAKVSATTFGANTSTITAFGKIDTSETLTDATDEFGTETGSLLGGTLGSISVAVQLKPRMDSAKIPGRPMEKNNVVWHHYGGGVFERNKQRLVKITQNV